MQLSSNFCKLHNYVSNFIYNNQFLSNFKIWQCLPFYEHVLRNFMIALYLRSYCFWRLETDRGWQTLMSFGSICKHKCLITAFSKLFFGRSFGISDHSTLLWKLFCLDLALFFFQIKICSTSLELTFFTTTNSIFSLLTMNWSGVIVSFNFLICLKSLGMFESMTAFPFRPSTFHNSFGFW